MAGNIRYYRVISIGEAAIWLTGREAQDSSGAGPEPSARPATAVRRVGVIAPRLWHTPPGMVHGTSRDPRWETRRSSWRIPPRRHTRCVRVGDGSGARAW